MRSFALQLTRLVGAFHLAAPARCGVVGPLEQNQIGRETYFLRTAVVNAQTRRLRNFEMVASNFDVNQSGALDG